VEVAFSMYKVRRRSFYSQGTETAKLYLSFVPFSLKTIDGQEDWANVAIG